jgi:hypothetical protein
MNICVIDYETTGLSYFAPDFRITSAALQWQQGPGHGKTFFSEDIEEIKRKIEKSIDAGYTFVCHNLQFEYGCTHYVFPDLISQMQWIDTMRLVQVFDNGGAKAQRMASSSPLSLEDELAMIEGTLKAPTTGLGLVSAASRLLESKHQDHKKEAHNWLAANHGIRREHGNHLGLLPKAVLERYNLADVSVTLALYNHCLAEFKRIGYDWRQDHKLYTHIARRISLAKGPGIKVNRTKLARSIRRITNQVMLMRRAFRVEIWDEIEQYEKSRYNAWINGCKMPHAREKRKALTVRGSTYWKKNITFNINSGKQKKELFVDQMGFTPKFCTKKGDDLVSSKDAKLRITPQQALERYPSFKASHMPHYGPAGKIVQTKKKRELVLKQCLNLMALSASDGRWHHDLRACGTATGRNKGGR